MDRILLLLPRGPDAIAIGRALAASDAARCVAAYLPLESLPRTRHGLPEPKSFVSVVELETSDAVATARALRSVDARNALCYRVAERRLKTYPRDWPDESPTPGVTLVSPVCRALGTDRASFDAHWREHHAPLALRHHAGVWDYRQALVLECLSPEAPPFDGIARLAFRSLRDFETGLFDSKEGRRALAEDTARFVALDRSEAELLREIILKS
jgi:uncharacterized protein (TIGR02118 family)